MIEGSPKQFYDTIARYYDAENAEMTDDLVFYNMLLEESVHGPVLDVGCGTGRVTFHIAQAGAAVVGMDYSAEMLKRAQRRLNLATDIEGSVLLLQGDILTAPLDQQFALIIVPYNGMMHFHTQEDQIRVLERLHGWLRPGGQVVIDLPNPRDLFATPDDNTVVLERMFFEPESGHTVMQQSVSVLDRARQMMQVTWIYDELVEDGSMKRTVAPLTLRYIFPAELALLLRAAGLKPLAWYGDYDFSPFEDMSDRMIVVAGERTA